MLQRVIEQMPSPFQRGQSVLTLACGHLWSWNHHEAPPAEIDCIHCDDDYLAGASDEVRAMDELVRELRKRRARA